MKKILFLIITNFALNFLYAQSEREVCPYLQKAAESYCLGKHKKTIKTLNEFIKLYPDHLLTQEAMYARGLAAFSAGKENTALNYLGEVLKLNTYTEPDSFGYSILLCDYLQPNCKNILIPDYLLNLQHEACLLMYDLEMKRKNYAKAFIHLDNASRYYRLWSGCGNYDLEESIRLALKFSEYYDELKQTDSAIYVLFPYLFEPAAFPMKNYEALCKTAAEKLIKLKGLDDVKIELARAVREVFAQTYKDNHDHDANVWFIYFYGHKIKASPEYLHSNTHHPDEVQQYLMQTPFFKIIFNLP